MTSSRGPTTITICHSAPGLNKLNGKVFRIGHLGWLNEIMVMQALCGVELAMRDVGIPFEPGAGVGAAVRIFPTPAKPCGWQPNRFHGLRAPYPQ